MAKYIAVKTDADQLVYLDGNNWYSDQGITALDEPYPDNFKATLVSHLSSVIRDGNALHNRLSKTKTEFASYSEILTNELKQFKSTSELTVNFGSHNLPVAEAIRRTEISLKMLSDKIVLLDGQIAQLPSRIDLAKTALANLTVQKG